MTSPKVVIVILNWNNYSDTADCITSVLELSYGNKEVIVVDNASSDNSGVKLEQDFPNVEFLYNKQNRGFGAGNNEGIKESIRIGADYVWLLNNDTIIAEDHVLSKVVKRMESNPTIGVLTPLIKKFPETERVWFEQGTINWRIGHSIHENNHRWIIHGGSNKSFTRFQELSKFPDTESLVQNEYVPLACSLIRTKVFEEVGLLPEQYFLYWEDVDFGTKVLQEGYWLATDTSVEAYHKAYSSSRQSKSRKSGRMSPTSSYYGTRNRWLFANEFSDYINKPMFCLSYLMWIGILLAVRIQTGEFTSSKAILQGVVDGIRGRTGKGPYP